MDRRTVGVPPSSSPLPTAGSMVHTQVTNITDLPAGLYNCDAMNQVAKISIFTLPVNSCKVTKAHHHRDRWWPHQGQWLQPQQSSHQGRAPSPPHCSIAGHGNPYGFLAFCSSCACTGHQPRPGAPTRFPVHRAGTISACCIHHHRLGFADASSRANPSPVPPAHPSSTSPRPGLPFPLHRQRQSCRRLLRLVDPTYPGPCQ